MRYNILLICSLALAIYSGIAFAEQLTNENLPSYKNYSIPEIKKKGEMEEKASRLNEMVRSPGFQDKIKQDSARLTSKLLGDKDPTVTIGSKSAILKDDERIFIFISSSIPLETLRKYANDMDRLKDSNIIMVMRGFKGGIAQIMPTINFIKNIVITVPGCLGEDCQTFGANVNIDPVLFTKYSIDVVPAIVYAKGIRVLAEGECGADEPVPDHYTVKGDANLLYSLEVINREAKSSSVDAIIKKLHGKY